jgi:hypothetical protein
MWWARRRFITRWLGLWLGVVPIHSAEKSLTIEYATKVLYATGHAKLANPR